MALCYICGSVDVERHELSEVPICAWCRYVHKIHVPTPTVVEIPIDVEQDGETTAPYPTIDDWNL